MDIVSPVMTFDIGAIAPDNPFKTSLLNAAIKDSTDYVKQFLTPQFTIFANDITKLEEFKKLTGDSLEIDECLTYLVKDVEYRYPLEQFNDDPDKDAYIFFDSFYWCCVTDELGLDYPDTEKVERYMVNHLDTIRKVNKGMKLKYADSATPMDKHIILFANFFVTLRNKPFCVWDLFTDDYGDVYLVK